VEWADVLFGFHGKQRRVDAAAGGHGVDGDFRALFLGNAVEYMGEGTVGDGLDVGGAGGRVVVECCV